jgi:soluble lytic murein transglycosylase-like protein
MARLTRYAALFALCCTFGVSTLGCAGAGANAAHAPGRRGRVQAPTSIAEALPAPPGHVSLRRADELQPIVYAAADEFGVDPSLINAVIWTESRFDAHAKSSAGARGLMQLMPATARSLADRMDEPARPHQPRFNVRAGTLYLARMLKRYDGDEKLALAAYAAGPGNVDKWLKTRGGQLSERTERYTSKVLKLRDEIAAVAARGARQTRRR